MDSDSSASLLPWSASLASQEGLERLVVGAMLAVGEWSFPRTIKSVFSGTFDLIRQKPSFSGVFVRRLAGNVELRSHGH
jgi:hypothetical protein